MEAAATTEHGTEDGGAGGVRRGGGSAASVERGPLLPRPDLANKEDDNDSNSSSSGGSNKAAASVASSNGNSRRPPHPPGNNDQRRKHLPVQSSGYGRRRPSTPLAMERRHSRALPNSPAHSIASASGARSARAATSRLRHGDGTPSHLLAGDGGPSARARGHRPGRRARTASPAPSLGRLRAQGGEGGRTKRMARSRTPSPAAGKVGKRSREGSGGSSALKRLKEGRREAMGGSNNNGDNALSTCSSWASPSRKDYGRIDADPTPVKEARRLSSNFRIYPLAPALLSSPAPEKKGEEEGEGSHSKALRKGPENDDNGGGTAASPPMSAAKPFQRGSGQESGAGAESSPSSERPGPTRGEIASLSDAIFSLRSGIDAPAIRRLLSQSSKGRGEMKQWELRKRLERTEEEASVLRVALRELLAGTEAFVKGAVGIEERLRGRLDEARGTAEGLARDKAAAEAELDGERGEGAATKEKLREVQREREALATECELLRTEVAGAKEEAARLRAAHADSAAATARLENKLEESEARNEALNGEVEALRAQEAEVRKMMGVEAASVDFPASADGEGDNSFLAAVKARIERYQEDARALEQLDNEYDACKAALEKATADREASLEALAAKERDLSELTKSIGDLQRAGRDREREATSQRQRAEERAAAAEGRAADGRERLAALGAEKTALEEALAQATAACASREEKVATLQKELSESKVDAVQHDSRLRRERDLRTKAEEEEAAERSERIALAAQLNARLSEHAVAQTRLRESMEEAERNHADQLRRREEEATAKEAEVQRCRETIAALEARQRSLTESLSDQKTLLDANKEEQIGTLKGEIANLESKLQSLEERSHSADAASAARVRELEELVRKGQAERKRMHHLLQELRGNVRVFARIRPFVRDDGEEGEGGGAPCVLHESDTVVSVPKQNDPSERHRFSFDRVFAPSAGQETVFDEVSEFVQSSLDGYNVCLMSYGQTGSGKTFTVQGTGTGQMRGLIPRSIEQIAQHKAQMETDGWRFAMEVSFLEIYNESVRDLLRENSREECKHEIKVGSDGRRTVTNLTVKPIDPSNREAVEAVLTLAAKRRSTASTDMNATSSRSHSVFTLNLTAQHGERNQLIRGTLNLVDLAGSERLDRSAAVGQQAKEAVSINKSLSSLADVFTAIGQKQSHVPFRNSKLTYLLQPALSGDGKTLMFVNISPTEASVQESLCSLRFASTVNKCELGKAKRTVEAVKSNASKRGNATNGNATSAARNVKRKM